MLFPDCNKPIAWDKYLNGHFFGPHNAMVGRCGASRSHLLLPGKRK
jgi:hypothetical protein